MKKIFLTAIVITTSLISLLAQDVKDVISKGNNVYIEVIDIRDNIKEDEHKVFVDHLMDKEEWNRWNIVDSKEKANFICKLSLEKRGSSKSGILSAGSWVNAIAEILTVNGDKVWESKKHRGNSSEFTGFNALNDAMRKIVRRALTKELYGEDGDDVDKDDDKEEKNKKKKKK